LRTVMAKKDNTKEVDDKLAVLANDGEPVPVEEAEDESAPMYRMMADDKIPVSKKLGPLWSSRKKAAFAKIKSSGELTRWDEAYQYYRNDHKSDNDPLNKDETDRDTGTRITTRGKETENIVFANTSSLVPAVYAKNPTIEITADNPDFDEFAKTGEKLVNALLRPTISGFVTSLPPSSNSIRLLAKIQATRALDFT